MALTKAELIEHLMSQRGFSRRDAKAFVDQFFELIMTALVAGEEVKLSGFGNFITRDKEGRPGRNPKTKETYLIAPRRVVTFRAGNKLRNIITRELKSDHTA